jgi:membrane-bound lytic murein transglycosylase D
VDERWDPICSSQAAARLLKQSHEILGDWPTAVTAYNHGIAGMLRAKRSKGNYEAVFREYRSRTFKFASRNFYAEFLAAREVAKNYKRYFGDPALDTPLESRKVTLQGYVAVEDLCRHFNLEPDDIRIYNPSLRRPVFHGQKYIPEGYALKLPVDAVEDNQVASVDLPADLYRPRQRRTRFYRVQRGDTAGEIAKMHGVKLSDLVLANHLDFRATIYAGQNLRIPAPDEKLPILAVASTADSISIAGTQDTQKVMIETSPETLHGGAETLPEAKEVQINPEVVAGNFLVERLVSHKGRQVGIIRVEVEETLGHYADWLGVPTREIRRLNGFPYGKPIRLNDTVKIPLEKISKEAFEERRFEYHKEIEEDFFASYRVKDVEIYRIKDGDNIWTLCQEVFELPFWLIYKYNPDLVFQKLSPSQELLVPQVEEAGKT